MYVFVSGAIPVVEGHYSSGSLPLLPAGTMFECSGYETALSQCRTEDEMDIGECIRDDAGVVCQG